MEALAVVAAIVGLTWGAILLLRGGLLAGCLAVLLAGTCFGVPFFKVELGPVPLTADRLLLMLVVGQYIVWRRWGLADPKPLGKAEIVLLALVGIMVLSTFIADWQARNYQPLSWLIIYYLMPAVIYWIARQSRLSQQELLTLFGALAVFGVYLAATALAEYFQVWWLVFPKYIATTAAQADAEFVGRGRGPLLNPIANGILMTVCLGGAMMWWPRLKRAGQLMLLAIVVVLITAIGCTLTRSVWMGGILAMALVGGLTLPRSWRWPMLVAGAAAAILLAAIQWENLLAFKRDKALAAEKTAESVELRPIMAVVAWHMFLDRPVLGCGYSQYLSEHQNYLSDRSTNLPLERARGYIPHNVLLSLLTETGLVGTGLFLALLTFWTRDAWQLWRDAGLPLWARQQGLLMLIALGAYLVNGMFHDVSVVPMANMWLFFLAGVTGGVRATRTAIAGGSAGGISQAQRIIYDVQSPAVL
jgi:O-antigen ligase